MANNKLNNRGYVLVEIILASVIAFGIAYYMLDLTIKLKNKNDDILAKTIVQTDKAIIQNKLVEYIEKDTEPFDCNNIIIDPNNKTISYKTNSNLIDIINSSYIQVETKQCVVNDNIVNIIIPLTVTPLNESFDVKLDYVLR